MTKKSHTARQLHVVLVVAAVVLLLAFRMLTGGKTEQPDKSADGQTDRVTEQQAAKGNFFGENMKREFASAAKKALYNMFMPCALTGGTGKGGVLWIVEGQIESLLPLYGYLMDGAEEYGNGEVSMREILLAEAEGDFLTESTQGGKAGVGLEQQEETAEAGQGALEGTAGAGQGIQGGTAGVGQDMSDVAEGAKPGMPEGAAWAGQSGTAGGIPFLPHLQQAQIDREALKDYETLLKQFYTVDSNTTVGRSQLDVEKLLGREMQIDRESPGPQILIYHTHSREAFADSVPGDSATSIVGVGEYLTELLTNTYGYEVLHHTSEYDTVRNEAYSKALPEIEKLLKDNPSIQVVIDLHRDEMAEETRLVMDLDGRPTARFMFFNGLSRTKKTGNIAYLYNENLQDNLAFSFQMQLKAAEYYPGLTRKIYLKGYRYNMHLRDKYLLVELGAQNNTVEEAMNACDPLAHILDMVLSGSG